MEKKVNKGKVSIDDFVMVSRSEDRDDRQEEMLEHVLNFLKEEEAKDESKGEN